MGMVWYWWGCFQASGQGEQRYSCVGKKQTTGNESTLAALYWDPCLS